MAKLTRAEAIKTEWCQVIGGVIHAAIWNDNGKGGEGYLTTYTTTTDRKGTEVLKCAGQSWLDLDKLEHRWDDRAALAKKLKLKVCKVCEDE